MLSSEGSIFVHLDDNESDYAKILLDEVFGRANFINRVTIAARSPSAFSTVNPGVFKASEYLLWYAKSKDVFEERALRVKREPDYAYNKWLENPEDPPRNWRLSSLLPVYSAQPKPRSAHPKSIVEHFNRFVVDNAERICRTASISDTGAGQAIIDLKTKSMTFPGEVLCLERGGGLDDVYVLNGEQLIFYSKNIVEIDGERAASKLLTNIWTDIPWEGIASEGGVVFKKGKKPERLIRRCLELTTDPGDLVLDSFAGSGTTGAVAQKMGRRWIMVEIGEHAQTHIVPRLRRVIDGTDRTGITQALGWTGGGAFRFCRLAPSLIARDRWGREVISPDYNGPLLAQALCKLEGFRFEPSETEWWIHGRSSETDFLHVTTQTLSHAQLTELAELVGESRTLLVLCGAWRGNATAFGNLTVRKIPDHVLKRCDWGRDSYALPEPIEAAE